MIKSFLNRFMSQNWEDLVMLHYRVNPAIIQGRLPDDLEVDTYEDEAWISVVAFRLSNLLIRPISWLKWSDFWELNLRTYIRDKKGRKGVWFFSLDSTDPIGVIGARMLYGLPYNNAHIVRSGSLQVGHLSFSSTRKGGGLSTIDASWNTTDINQNLAGKKIDHFLLERYRFWASRSRVKPSSSACVNHQRYNAVRLNMAKYQGELFVCQGMCEPISEPELGHYCPGFSVEATAPEWAFSISGQANQR